MEDCNQSNNFYLKPGAFQPGMFMACSANDCCQDCSRKGNENAAPIYFYCIKYKKKENEDVV